jgi:hypothetical protein
MTTPYTTVALLAELERCGYSPRVEGHRLTFDPRPPDVFLPVIRLLHTGIRAILTRRTWLACSTTTGWAQMIDTNKPVPSWVGLLAVQKDTKWDRIRSAAKFDLPYCFMTQDEPKGRDRLTRLWMTMVQGRNGPDRPCESGKLF